MPLSNKLFYNTVTPLLHKVLKALMAAEEFELFRLVGGTALSLRMGHRESVDIDLFTDAKYKTIDFNAIDTFLYAHYPYMDTSNVGGVAMGKSYFVGKSKNEAIKLDVYYTDDFIRPLQVIDGIRLASVEDIVGMKVDVIGRGGRKKDFWDIHELKDTHTFKEMLKLHEERYPYNHNKAELKKNFTDFKVADKDADPICLKDKKWEIIKLDIIDFASE